MKGWSHNIEIWHVEQWGSALLKQENEIFMVAALLSNICQIAFHPTCIYPNCVFPNCIFPYCIFITVFFQTAFFLVMIIKTTCRGVWLPYYGNCDTNRSNFNVHDHQRSWKKVFLPPRTGFLRRNFPNIEDEFS